ncbi:MAG: tRNA (uridine(34)/cytosine(34)/5-carboxymethylaminomethyluridine(34)-2'-O)-methyltransferase TrmL [Chloracidobacterium sp. CP2_5A]|nr:MAG: tRNA (uridine(34)/cytosine(34)/5-carboxymethylaminomethyluridine(34)-2'-O)-methyltransferase TrmL [Chloracidobacterium sp. CP2_5A]
MQVVLVEPEIHVNTGNIARTCVCVGATLHLVHPLGFSIDDRALRRAGLDYWQALDLHEWESFAALRAARPDGRFVFIETVGARRYDEIAYGADDFLVFGRETSGLPAALLEGETVARIPMISNARSLNLSNAVALTLYEALRQGGFPGLR